MGGIFGSSKVKAGGVEPSKNKLKNISLYKPKNKKDPTYSDKIFTIDLTGLK